MARASSSAVIGLPSGSSRSNVCVASIANRTSKPRLAPTRAVVSQQWLVVMPHTAMPVSPRVRSHPARSARRGTPS